ncbi:MAG: hypothetical protein QOE61_2571, partial [Micromonosporaceae bacterium]|nr:hypothetical protein [Micromonosporaceae bacterium]
ASNTVAAAIPVGGGPDGVAITPDGRRVYVTNSGYSTTPGNNVSVIDTASNAVIATIPNVSVTSSSGGVAIAPDGRRAYVASYHSLSVIDTASNTFTDTVPGGTPVEIAITPDGRRAYVAGGRSNAVTAVSLPGS